MNNDGVAKLNPSEATYMASVLRNNAAEIENLLNDVRTRMQDVNDSDVNMYHGKYKPSELKDELDQYASGFPAFHQQVDEYAALIDEICRTMENE